MPIGELAFEDRPNRVAQRLQTLGGDRAVRGRTQSVQPECTTGAAKRGTQADVRRIVSPAIDVRRRDGARHATRMVRVRTRGRSPIAPATEPPAQHSGYRHDYSLPATVHIARFPPANRTILQ